MKISAVIITKNEEKNIRRCLESLKGVADEIIVLDGESLDKTRNICVELGALVINQKWLGYAATKNAGNALTKHPYILSIDADEALSDELKSSILGVKDKLEGVYTFNRLAFYCGKPIRHCGWYPDVKPRLFPREKAKWEGEFVHEKLVLSPDLVRSHLAGDLLHYTYYTVDEHLDRARKYAELASRNIAEKGKSGLLFKALFSPIWRFFQMYFLRLGFLDGYYGYIICRITAKEVRWKYAGARRLNRKS